ncbi:MAG: dihydroneopterin aldolase, partial [Planktomarina sp.]|nr:dihydroneopterin aldolase [Planktomarina sp.]
IDTYDRISVRDHIITVEIGAFQAERGTTQRIRFDVVVEVQPLKPEIEDDVDRILSYDRVTEAIEAALSEERLNLLETLAERVAERILTAPQAQRVFVRIEKVDRGPGNLGVEIVRERSRLLDVGLRTLEDTPHPIVLFLANSVVAGAYLSEWIAAAETNARPVIICVDAPEASPPTVFQHKMVQRRIDLLAIEQNAWVLASHDDRCVVVETKTELDWGMRHDQISVWAPSKIVLNAVDGPSTNMANMPLLVEWFAKEMLAAQLVFVGATPTGNLSTAREARADQPEL